MVKELFTETPSYPISGVGPYPVTHPYAEGALRVIARLNGVYTELSTDDYSVDPVSSDTEGALTLTAAAALLHDGASLLIDRATALQQGWAGQAVREKSLETQLDLVTMAVQDLQDRMDRSVQVANRETGPTLGAASQGKALIFDEVGNLVPGPDADEIAGAQTQAEAAAASAANAALYDGIWIDDSAALLVDAALTYTADQPGTVVEGSIVQTRNGPSYKVANAAATDAHIQNAATPPVLFYVNHNDWVLNALAWGVNERGDDSAADYNTAALQSMVAHARANNQKAELVFPAGGDVRINRPIPGWHDLIVNFGQCRVVNILAAEGTSGDLSTRVLALGAFARLDEDDWSTWSPCGAIAKQSAEAVPADLSGFNEGDLVLIVDANSTLGQPSGPPLQDRYHITQIMRKTTGLAFKDPIDFDIEAGTGTLGAGDTAGAWIANIDITQNVGNDAGLVVQRGAVRGMTVLGGILENQSKAIWSRSALYEGLIEGVEFQRNAYGLFGNGFVKCMVRDHLASAFTRIGEMKVGSLSTIIENLRAYWTDDVNDTSDPPETLFSWGEKATDCVYRGGYIDLSANPLAGSLFTSAGAIRSGIEGMTFRGNMPNITTAVNMSDDSVDAFFRRNTVDVGDIANFVAFAGTNSDVSHNTFVGQGTTSFARIQDGAVGGQLAHNHCTGEGVVFTEAGHAEPARVIGNHGVTAFTGNPELILKEHNTSDAYNVVKAAVGYDDISSNGISVTSTTEVLITDALVVPAAMLTVGSTLTFRFAGEKDAANTANLSLALAIDVDNDGTALDPDDALYEVLDQAIPSTCRDWTYEVEFKVTSATRMSYRATFINGTDNQAPVSSARFVGPDFANFPARFELRGDVSAGSMTVWMQEAELKSAGMI